MKLPTALEMKNLDQSASKNFGIPSIVLMENAGLGTVKMMEEELGSCKDTFAMIFIGPGNNGGDGLVIGRHLHQRGCQPVFFFLVNPDTLTGDSAVNLKIIRKLRLPFHVVDNAARVETIPVLFKHFESRGLPCYAIVDAIFGIGLCRKVSDHFADTINLINKTDFGHNAPVISVDTPSGMDSDTGKVHGTCICADLTATYCCAKPGHFIHGSFSWTGKLEIIDIGIPPEAIRLAQITTELASASTFSKLIRPLVREKASHKGNHGHLLLLAGSTGMTGAANLTANGALRTGAGLVTLCVPYDLNQIFETTLVEAMTIPLTQSSKYLSIHDWEVISDTIKLKQAVVIGPGMGKNSETADLVIRAYQSCPCPLVLDADALNILAENHSKLEAPSGPRIFTPHPGELARILDKSAANIQDNRLDAAILGCDLFKNDHYDIVMVLKGAGTIIAGSDGSTVINTTGNPGMATGGMGDVLSGVIGALICQGLSPLDASVAGAYMHGAAADILYDKYGAGFLASEVANTLPLVIKSHLEL